MNILKNRIKPAPYNILGATAVLLVSMMAMVIPQLILSLFTDDISSVGGIGNAYLQYFIIVIIAMLTSSISLRRFNGEDLGFTLAYSDSKFDENQSESHIMKLARIFLVAIIYAVIFNLIYLAISNIFPVTKTNPSKTLESFNIGKTLLQDLVNFFSITTVAPFWEEIVYRGLLFGGVYGVLNHYKLKYSALIAALTSALFFAGIHGGDGSSQNILIFIMGFIACLSYANTGSILAPMLFHSFNNVYAIIKVLNDANATLYNGLSPYILLIGPLILLILFFMVLAIYNIPKLFKKT